MKHTWYEAVGGLGLEIDGTFAGLITKISPTRYEIERYDGRTDVCTSDGAARIRLLTMLGIAEPDESAAEYARRVA